MQRPRSSRFACLSAYPTFLPPPLWLRSGSAWPTLRCSCQARPPLASQLNEQRVVCLAPGASVLLDRPGPNPANDNSSVVLSFQVRRRRPFVSPLPECCADASFDGLGWARAPCCCFCPPAGGPRRPPPQRPGGAGDARGQARRLPPAAHCGAAGVGAGDGGGRGRGAVSVCWEDGDVEIWGRGRDWALLGHMQVPLSHTGRCTCPPAPARTHSPPPAPFPLMLAATFASAPRITRCTFASSRSSCRQVGAGGGGGMKREPAGRCLALPCMRTCAAPLPTPPSPPHPPTPGCHPTPPRRLQSNSHSAAYLESRILCFLPKVGGRWGEAGGCIARALELAVLSPHRHLTPHD